MALDIALSRALFIIFFFFKRRSLSLTYGLKFNMSIKGWTMPCATVETYCNPYYSTT